MINAVGRDVPDHIPGYGAVRPFAGAFAYPEGRIRTEAIVMASLPGVSKLQPDLQAALDACELRDGATISFHHHLRNGDRVLNMVLDEIARRGIKGVHVAASSLFPVHEPLLAHIRSGVVAGISATYISGPLAVALSQGALPTPVVMYTHGGRARAIRLPTLRDEVEHLADLLADEHHSGGRAWGDMAILCHDHAVMDVCAAALQRRRLPHQVRRRSGDYRPAQDAIRVMTMRVSKGLEFPVVAIPGLGAIPAPGADEKEEARLFYVAATRATDKLLLTASGDGGFGKRFVVGVGM